MVFVEFGLLNLFEKLQTNQPRLANGSQTCPSNNIFTNGYYVAPINRQSAVHH